MRSFQNSFLTEEEIKSKIDKIRSDTKVKFIHPSVEEICICDPLKKIEYVGRTCYKSTDKITDTSAIIFYNNLIARGHFAMIEHATFCFQVNASLYDQLRSYSFLNRTVEEFSDGRMRYLISGNLRAINETQETSLLSVLYHTNPRYAYIFGDKANLVCDYTLPEDSIKLVDIDSLEDIQREAYFTHKYFTFKFTCDRGVSHEIVRHRPASFAQESTRYCNYTKDKFGKELCFIYPTGYDNWDEESKTILHTTFKFIEEGYFSLIDSGKTPQQARAILPNGLKTEVIMTANAKEFDHFFDLRSRGTTGSPHPDMKVVADMALKLFNSTVEVKKFSD